MSGFFGGVFLKAHQCSFYTGALFSVPDAALLDLFSMEEERKEKASEKAVDIKIVKREHQLLHNGWQFHVHF